MGGGQSSPLDRRSAVRRVWVVCAAALCVLSGTSCERSAESPTAQGAKPDIVLITLDTTRADHLGFLGYPKPTSQHLDRLAAQAVIFTNAIAQASVTPVSHASIFTGLNPYSHGLRVMHGVAENRLAESQVTLAEMLGQAGYQTAAFVSAFPAGEYFGLDQGFGTFDADFLKAPPEDLVSEKGIVDTALNQRHAGDTTDRALPWLATARSPFFLWLHYFDPHDPWMLPPQEVLDRHKPFPKHASGRERLRFLYDIEIEYMDEQINRVLDRLEENGSYGNTIIVVVADHGQGLGDHDWWTHGVLYQEQVRVPLVIRAPTVRRAHEVDFLVRTIDIVPTLIDLAGLPPDDSLKTDGHSLVPLMAGAAADPGYEAYSDSVNMLTYGFTARIWDVKDDMLFALIRHPWKYIHHVLRPHESELYDLATDSRESRNVLQANPGVAEALRAELMARKCIPARQLDGREGEMSQEVLDRLRSLGYLDD